MDNQQVKNFIVSARQKGIPDSQILAYVKQKTAPVTEKVGYSDTGSDIKQVGTGIANAFKDAQATSNEAYASKNAGEQTGAEAFFQTMGAGAKALSNSAGEIVKGAVKVALPQEAETAVKQGIAQGVNAVSDLTSKYEELKKTKPVLAGAINLALGTAPDTALSVKDIIDGYNQLKVTNPRLAKNLDGALGIGQLAFDVATLGGSKAVATAGKEVIEQGGKQAAKAIGEAGTKAARVAGDMKTSLTKTATETIDLAKKKLGPPEPTLEQAVGQVIQGKSTDVAKAQKAIQSIDTKGVKTYKDLANKLQEKKKELVGTVDNELAKDTTLYPIESLTTKATTKSGKVVSTNHVSKSLSDLKEYYRTVGDAVKESEIDDLIAKNAFTRKDVNDISRIYNEEFGTKAFGKTGEPLTSVNAQAYENTRKGLKDVARQGIGGSEAKLADESLSAIYNTEKLVKRNIEAVNKLQQRINERGILEKAGNVVAKYGDILTGGTIRGVVGGLLPRGAGYKVLNALDLEEQLAKNLEIINKAMNAKSDDALVKAIKKLEASTKNK